jgi:transcriptional regulator with XRE-family HTH domain
MHMKTLDAWMTENGVSGNAMAARCCVSVSMISRIRSGQRLPSLKVAGVIRKATDGQVTEDSYLSKGG